MYVFLSNEEPYELQIGFDDYEVTHQQSAVVQMEEYYPFGLTFNSYQRENSTPNKFKFQGQEHVDDLNLGWVSFKWRNHQPEIGRFFNVDPLADKYVYNSPYAFSENRVIDGRELEGLEWQSVTKSDGTTTRQLTVQLENKSSLTEKQVNSLITTMSTDFAKNFGGEGSDARLVVNQGESVQGNFVVTLTDQKSTPVTDASGNVIGKTYKVVWLRKWAKHKIIALRFL